MPSNLGLGLGLVSCGVGGGRGSGVSISFPPSSVSDTATVGTVVNTASLIGAHTGTPVWALTNSAGGKYAINSSTGTVTVAAALTAETDSITIAVSGLTPSVPSATFSIVVSSSGYTPSLDFSDSRNSMYLPIAA